MVKAAGRRNDKALRVSIRDVWRAPIIAKVPVLCTDDSCFSTFTNPLNALLLHSPCRGWHQRSAPYNTLGSAMLIYKRLAYLGVMPHEGLATLRICATQVAPFLIAFAC